MVENLKPVFECSVREWVRMVHASGDLVMSVPDPVRAAEGIRTHRYIQSLRPEGYLAEVPLTQLIGGAEFDLFIQGRLDGWMPDGREPGWLEEIKTCRGAGELEFTENHGHPIHWAQLKVYAAMLALSHDAPHWNLRLTYVDPKHFQRRELDQTWAREALISFFIETLNIWWRWIEQQQEHLKRRNQSLSQLKFPYGAYRAGQRELTATAYRAIQAREHLLVEAPTGSGKTMAMLFAGLVSLGQGLTQRVFFLSCKTTGQLAALGALHHLRQSGAHLRSLVLTAREKICRIDGRPCAPETCPRAEGYFDRLRPALEEVHQHEDWTRESIEEVATQYQLCPFEFSLELSRWVDVIIGDVNYAFDPGASLRRHFETDAADALLLIDEAHNLPDRAREMFSARLELGQIKEARRMLARSREEWPRALGQLQRLFFGHARVAEVEATQDALCWQALEPPATWIPCLQRALEKGSEWLQAHPQHPAYSQQQNLIRVLRELFRELHQLPMQGMMVWLGTMRPAQETDAASQSAQGNQAVVLMVQCLDPGPRLAPLIEAAGTALCFSGTLVPGSYFQQTLFPGLPVRTVRIPSSFPPENVLRVIHTGMDFTHRHRDKALPTLVDWLIRWMETFPGNHLVFLPSFVYLQKVREVWEMRGDGSVLHLQQPGMDDAARRAWLDEFQPGGQKVGLAVLGGAFAEGVDLPGDRLIGAVVVGLGLPALNLPRHLMREFYHQTRGDGFAYACLYPALQRVLQAIGRVIRTPNDRGVIALLDQRFARAEVRELLPPDWERAIRWHPSQRFEDLPRPPGWKNPD